MEISALINRLQKNQRHWGKWAKRRGISCYRIYDRDIPEFPLAVDCYEDQVHAQVFARKGIDGSTPDSQNHLAEAVCKALDIPADRLSIKTRQRQRGLSQYEKTGQQARPFIVHEAGLAFEVDLHRYLDTGLFLDHRLTRSLVRDCASGKRVLNLFCYTGSFTVYAAAGEARSITSVDLSKTYLSWAQRNLKLNQLASDRHEFAHADVINYLAQMFQEKRRFDLIVLDPPSFSNSKRMRHILDIQGDHPGLIQACLQLLTPGGELIFSTNRRKFRLELSLPREYEIRDITQQTIPEDFRRHPPHQCWMFRKS